jgi:hypothetical protein
MISSSSSSNGSNSKQVIVFVGINSELLQPMMQAVATVKQLQQQPPQLQSALQSTMTVLPYCLEYVQWCGLTFSDILFTLSPAGAIQTIEKLLKNAEKRAAAITTLGKTVERCRAKLSTANPAFVASLFNVLDGVSEASYQYDIEWINNNMQRTRQQQVRGVWSCYVTCYQTCCSAVLCTSL